MILETFYTLFKSDTSDLDKGLEESKRKGGELAEALKNTDGTATALGSTLKDLAIKGAALFGIGLSVKTMWGTVNEVAAQNFELAKLADRYGTTADAIDEFLDAGELLGISNEVTKGGLASLDRAVQDTALGLGRAKKVFEELGIEVQDANGKIKPLTTVMEDLQNKIGSLDKGTQIRIMERLGLDPSLLKLFNADIGDLQKRMAAIDSATGFSLDRAVKRSKEFTKAQKEMKLEVATLGMYLGKLKESFTVDSMPIFTKGIQLATEWLRKLVSFVLDNGMLVKGALIAISGAITYFLLPAAIRGALAVAAMIAPFVLVGLAVAAVAAVFALAYDDIMNFMDGNDSLIGQLMAKYPVIGDIVTGVGDVFKWLADTVISIFDIIIAVWQKAFQLFKDLFMPAVDGAASSFGIFGEIAKAVGDLVGGIFKYWIDLIGQFIDKFGGLAGIAKTVGGAISGALKGAKSMLGIEGGGVASQALEAGKAQLGMASSTPLAANNSNSVNNSKQVSKTNNVTVGKVEVHTQATDGAGIAKTIGDSMGAQMRQAVAAHDDGVAI